MDARLLSSLLVQADTKIIMIVMDGLGGLPQEPGGQTELETARTPNLDRLAVESELGLTIPAGHGVTVSSGPGHLALFGYDPFQYNIGRGPLEAMGVDFEARPGDVAARGNFCSVDVTGSVTDRRAGRIPTPISRDLVKRLDGICLDGIEFRARTIKEHRLAFVMRGEDLGEALTGSDPQRTGVPPLAVRAREPGSERMARAVNRYLDQARQLLADERPANMILLRGFDRFPEIPSFATRYGLRAAALAANGMYRGVARLTGMTVLDLEGESPEAEFSALEKHWPDWDFFYLHIKETDTAGEDGDFCRKVRAIEAVDAQLPRLMALEPDVVLVAGDHSSPAVLKSHSWHPVPLLLYSAYVRADGVAEFGERACRRGSLGQLAAQNVMSLALAHAGRLAKFGA